MWDRDIPCHSPLRETSRGWTQELVLLGEVKLERRQREDSVLARKGKGNLQEITCEGRQEDRRRAVKEIMNSDSLKLIRNGQRIGKRHRKTMEHTWSGDGRIQI